MENIGSHTGNQGRRRKLINVYKGEALDLLKNIMAKIFGKSRCGLGTGKAGNTATAQGSNRHYDQKHTLFDQLIHLGAAFDIVDKVCRNKRNKGFNNRLTNNKKQRQKNRKLILSDAFCKSF
jgi:hypothetical protein